ncbi:MAG: hypothetical protein ABFS17_06860 [Chloroflexota bacterium]
MNLGTKEKLKQLMDWSAALWGGFISGIVFFVVNILLSQIVLGSPWVYLRIIASIIMGPRILPPPATFDIQVFFAALIVHFAISIIGAIIISFAVYRWGLIVGFIGGGVLGLAFYVINFYALSFFFPWVFPYRSWIMMASHIVYGALAGGIYELLEIEEFVIDEDSKGDDHV